jgi:Ca2+-binding EF-hand superfamily protein
MSMQRICLATALFALVSVSASSAVAAEKKAAPAAPATSVQRILQRMDRDNNGQVGFEEYRNAMTRRFHAVDKNADGALQASEIPPEWVVVDAADVPAAGLALDAFADHMRASFNSFDANHDNSLDHDELTALADARAAKLEAKP